LIAAPIPTRTPNQAGRRWMTTSAAIEAQHRVDADQRHRQQPDPDAGVVAGAAPEQRQQSQPGEVDEQHQPDERLAVGSRADPRHQHQHRGAGRVLPPRPGG
jgi:hypothetical protein